MPTMSQYCLNTRTIFLVTNAAITERNCCTSYLWHIELLQSANKVLDDDIKVMVIETLVPDKLLVRPPHIPTMVLLWTPKSICHETHLHSMMRMGSSLWWQCLCLTVRTFCLVSVSVNSEAWYRYNLGRSASMYSYHGTLLYPKKYMLWNPPASKVAHAQVSSAFMMCIHVYIPYIYNMSDIHSEGMHSMYLFLDSALEPQKNMAWEPSAQKNVQAWVILITEHTGIAVELWGRSCVWFQKVCSPTCMVTNAAFTRKIYCIQILCKELCLQNAGMQHPKILKRGAICSDILIVLEL